METDRHNVEAQGISAPTLQSKYHRSATHVGSLTLQPRRMQIRVQTISKTLRGLRTPRLMAHDYWAMLTSIQDIRATCLEQYLCITGNAR